MPNKSKNSPPVETPGALRRRAQRLVRKHDANLPEIHAQADIKRLVHELEVHQIELEMQNAELRTARDETEAMLQKYSNLYDLSPVGYFTLTTEGTIRLANLTGSTLVRVERSKLVDRSFAMLLAPEHRSRFRAFLKQVFAGEVIQSDNFMIVGVDLPPRIISIEAQRSVNESECSAVVADVTEHKRVEDEMRVSELRYRRLFEAAHDGVLLLDTDTCKITDANPFMTQLIGYPRDQLIGKQLYEIGLHKDNTASKEMFRELKQNDQVRYENLPLVSQSGRHQEVEVVANVYQEGYHSVIQCNIRDITERKQMEEIMHQNDSVTTSNLKLRQEIVARLAVEKDLRATRLEQSQLLKQSRLQQKQLRALSHGMLHAQEEERKQISRELHDVIAQTLLGINVHLSALIDGAAVDSENILQQISSTQLLVERGVEIVHQFARSLRPTMLDDLGLIPALKTFMQGFMEKTCIHVSLRAFANIEKSSDAVRTMLYRIAQEALTNVGRHSNASHAEVCIDSIDGTICMTIKDNGHGFDAIGTSSHKNSARLGLLGMRERVEMLGGTFRVTSTIGQSTIVRVEIPAVKRAGKRQTRLD